VAYSQLYFPASLALSPYFQNL